MVQVKKILTNCLLAFVFVSIGFALGKHSIKTERPPDRLSNGNGHYVAVYYLHSTFRCVTCNTIEKMTRELLDKAYSNELAEGKIKWIEDDFQENEALAKQFEVAASCVVVAELEDGVVLDYRRLDDVWIKMEDPEAFDRYVSEVISEYLGKVGGKS
ncbi:MAG: hypothetical protein EOM12_00765 [Verrucomicrobiae bacterium]|nr:hypothetical protein [Verrucomicrobiae bacterium]